MTSDNPIDAQDDLGRSALHRAALRGDFDEARDLIVGGALVDNCSCVGTPLYYAVDEGHLEIVRLLVDHGADVNRPNGIGDLPMDTALYNFQMVFDPGDRERYRTVIEFLVERGARQRMN